MNKNRTILIAAAIAVAVPLLVLRTPLLRFGIPALTLALLLFFSRGTLLYIAALRSASAGNTERALQLIRKAIGAGIGVERSSIATVVLLKYGNLEEVRMLFSRLAARNLSESERRKMESYRALLIWQEGNHDEAAAMLEGLLAEGYRTTHLYSTLGYFLLHTEGSDPWRALDLNREAVDYDATPDILDNLTAACIGCELWEEAGELSDRVLASNPKFAEAWYHAGIMAEAEEEWETAVERYRTALQRVFSPLSLLTREAVEIRLREAARYLPDEEESADEEERQKQP